MIEGIDVKIETDNKESLKIATQTIRSIWKDAVYEDAIDGHRYASFDEIPFREIKEIFVYTDEESADLWETKGAVKKALNRMIHLIRDDDALYVIFDKVAKPMEAITGAIKAAIINGKNP